MSTCERRNFLEKSALIGAGTLVAATSGHNKAEASKRPAFKRKSPSSLELLYVGFLGCDPSVHLSIWGAMTVVGENGSEFIDILVEGNREELFNFFFLPSLLAMQKLFESGEMPEPLDDILTKTRIFLSAWKSHVDHDGGPVDPALLPSDWQGPHMYFTRPDRYPEGFFGE